MSKAHPRSLFTRLLAMAELWNQHALDRSALAALREHELRDLGLGGDAIRIRSSNPVWRG
jgi:uncharacterized protein YjiS (DUF1127 family)